MTTTRNLKSLQGKRFVLATEAVSVEFHIMDAARVVVTVKRNDDAPYNPLDDAEPVRAKTILSGWVGPWMRTVLAIEHARAEYKRLVNAGFFPW